MHSLATIGYELATSQTLIAALRRAGIDLLVDVRAVPNSRRPGFSKKALTAAATDAGIEYLHLRGLGTPADGRAAARRGRHAEMRRIYEGQLETLAAQDDLHHLVDLIRAGRAACLLCLEADPTHCHRTLVAAAVKARLPLRVVDLFPTPQDPE